MSQVLAYNFNENSTSTIRDYSEQGWDGTGSNLTNQNSSIVGKDMIFNSSTDQIDVGAFDELDGVASFSLYLKIRIDSGTGTKQILTSSGQLDINYNYTTNTLNCNVTVGTGTATVSYSATVDTWYSVGFSYNGTAYLYIDGTQQDTDATQSGNIANSVGNLFIGDSGSSDSANITLNEILIYNQIKGINALNAWSDEPNGVKVDTGLSNSFELGDIVGFDVLKTTKRYGVISYVSGTEYRFYPKSSNIYGGMGCQRVGHLWDTDRQWALKIDDTPEICFYDGVSKSTDAFSSGKKLYCLNRNGIIKTSTTKTANYTVVSTDQIIETDTTSGNITITLESSPSTGREIEVIDYLGNNVALTNQVTISGNGNNINGSASQVRTAAYDWVRLRYNGTEWNMI